MKKLTKTQLKAKALERKYLDRAILRLTRTFYTGAHECNLSAQELRELLGLVRARARV